MTVYGGSFFDDWGVKRIHFVGIGGVGTSGIAELLHTMGFEVSGSDLEETEITQRLARLGIKVSIGHNPANVHGKDLIVYSTAVKEDNPELIKARELHIPCIPRAEMLAELTRVKRGIAVAGSHGKTTTTSLLGIILEEAGFDPTIVVGGILKRYNTNAKLGEGEFIVFEADESDRSFLKFLPLMEVITNIDLEHLETYTDIDDIKNTFFEFMHRVPFYGLLVLNLDDPNIREMLPRLRRRYVSYGLGHNNDWYADNIVMGERMEFDVFHKGRIYDRFTLSIPGRHHVLNALAAIVVAHRLNVPVDTIKRALRNFRGIKRRFDIYTRVGDTVVMTDYAHHPREIEAVILTILELHKAGRIRVIFEPHLYSRTKLLANEFARALSLADEVIVTKIYKAREEPIPGVTGELITRKCTIKARYIEDDHTIIEYLRSTTKDGDFFAFLGAGRIYKLAEEFAKSLHEKQ